MVDCVQRALESRAYLQQYRRERSRLRATTRGQAEAALMAAVTQMPKPTKSFVLPIDSLVFIYPRMNSDDDC